MKIRARKLIILFSAITLFFVISIIITPFVSAENINYNEIILNSFERGNQVDSVTGHYLIGNDPNSPTTLILGFNGTFGNASGTWILDTYYARDLQKVPSIVNAFIEVRYIPRLPPSQVIFKNEARVLVYINKSLVYEERLTYIIPQHESYGLVPSNSSRTQILVSDGIIKVQIPLTLLSSDRTEVRLEVRGNAIWEVDLVGIVIEISAPFWLRNLPIMILGATLAMISLILCMEFLVKNVKNIMQKRDRLIAILLLSGFILRISLAPFTQDDWDLPYFRNISLMYYLTDVNPLSIWDYGIGWLGVLLSYSSIGLLLKLLLKDIYMQYILNLFIKLPSIFADMFIPLLIYLHRKDLDITDINAKRFMALWIFNPYTIFVSSIWGQFDAIPTLLMLLSLVSLAKRDIFRSALLLGLGFLFKIFPILLLPLLTIVLLKSKGVKHTMFYITLVGLVGMQQVIAYYLFAPQLLANIVGYRAGIKQWGEYYQGLTYLNLLWRYGLTKYLYPSPFLTLYVLILATILLVVWYRKRDLFDIAKPQNIFTFAFLAFIPFFLSYNMVNQQYITWILPALMILSYGYGMLPKRILDLINIFLIIATASYIITPLRAFSGFSALFDLISFFFTIIFILLILPLIKPPKLRVEINKMHYYYIISALIALLIPIFLYNSLLPVAVSLQIISIIITLSFLFKHLHLYSKSGHSSLANILYEAKGTRLILMAFYMCISLQIAFVGSPFQSISIMAPIFGIASRNWIMPLFNVNNVIFIWLQIITLPQILLSISALSASLLCILRTKLNIYSIITPWLVISYIIIYVFHTPTGYSDLHEPDLPLLLIITCLLAFFITIFRGDEE